MKSVTQTIHFLWFLSALLVAGICVVFLIPLEKEAVELSEEGSPAVHISETDGSDFKRSSFEEYEKIFSDREVFKTMIRFSPNNEVKTGGGGQSSADVENVLAKKYKVIGIMIDQNSKAVFEDVNTRETIFLSSGEALDGAIIKEILPGKVILAIGGDVITMTP